MFLVSGRLLDVYHWRQGRCEGPLRFEVGDEGLERFSTYLSEEAPEPVRVVVDLVEEEFREDTIPRVVGPDRRALIQARRRRLFGSATFGCSLKLGRETEGRRNDRMLFAALTRPEKLTPWLKAIARNRVPLAGVHSLPLLTEQMLGWIPVGVSPALVVTWQYASGLRQTLFVDGRVKFSRLAIPHHGSGEESVHLQSEVEKVRRHLVRHSLLPAERTLDVYIISRSGLQEAIAGLAPPSAAIRYHRISLSDLGCRLGIEVPPGLVWCDRLFVSFVARRVPRHQYAPARELREYAMHRVRSALRAASLLAVAAGLLGGGSGLAGGYDAGRYSESLRAQTELYRQRYEEARKRLPPTPVEVPTMQLAVLVAEGLRAARTTPETMLRGVSRCLDLHSSVRLESIDWSGRGEPASLPASAMPSSLGAESDTAHATPAFAGVSIQSADIHGRIEPFDGDFRHALEQVGKFADSLRGLQQAVEVEVLSLPLDVGSQASLRGDASARAGAADAPFALRLSWNSRVRG